MKNTGNRSDLSDTAREQTAAEWIVKHEYGLTAEQQDEFLDWLTEDPKNRQAYITQSWAWGEIDRLAGLQKTDHAPVNSNLFDEIEIKPFYRKHAITMSIGIVAMAASLLLFIGLFIFENTKQTPQTKESTSVVFNRIEKQQFDDGSSAILNRGAVVSVEYTAEIRLVQLLKGEASFNIEEDINRPFIVEVKGVHVRAVGTQFNVKLSDESVDVIVTEGVVAVSMQNTDNAGVGESILEAHHRANIEIQGESMDVSVGVIEEVELAEELQWHPVLLEFDNASLIEIIAELNTRNEIEIIIADPSLESIRISSVIWSDNVVGFVGLLDSYFNIDAKQLDPQTIVLDNQK